jgi:hypothetical protein
MYAAYMEDEWKETEVGMHPRCLYDVQHFGSMWQKERRSITRGPKCTQEGVFDPVEDGSQV